MVDAALSPVLETTAPSGAPTFVFVDKGLAGLTALVQTLDPSWTVVLIDPAIDGLSQIQQALAGHTGVAAIHLLTHGAPGQLSLGSGWVNEETLGQSAHLLARIGESLAPGADILIYGCRVAEGEQGAAFVQTLVQLTRADVAASWDVTGSAARGGNWVLEYVAGQVTSLPVQAASFMGLLGLINGTAASDTLVGTSADDTIRGLGGSDLISGLGGDDQLLGNEGNDTLLGGNGRDWLTGGPGVDSLDGGEGNDTAFFEDAPAAVRIDLITGIVANDGFGNRETITGVENLHGSSFGDVIQMGNTGSYVFGRAGSDSLYGGTGDDFFAPGSGNDFVDGGAGSNRVSYFDDTFDGAGASTAGVTVNLVSGVAIDNWGQTDTLQRIEHVTGSPGADSVTGSSANNWLDGADGNDTLRGGDGEDTLVGGAGNDLLDGGGNVSGSTFDRVDYTDVPGAVNVNLATGVATGVYIGTDSLVGIEGVHASAYNDTLTGAGTADYFVGGAGDDLIDGGTGFDLVSYFSATAGVSVNLATGSVTGGAGNDTLVGIEGVLGSGFADSLVGGAAGEFFRGGAGNDTIDGAGGIDRAAYDFGPSDSTAINASLRTGIATGAGFGTDTLLNIENMRGSNFNDTLEGNDGNNDFQARSGNDTVLGLGGNDNLLGEAGNDSLLGGSGADTLTGGVGDDTLDGGEQLTLPNPEDTVNVSNEFDVAVYSDATSGVTVTLGADGTAGTATGGGIGTDVLRDIEYVIGSAFADLITGTNRNVVEIFRGGKGDDTIRGGDASGTDLNQNYVDYRDAEGAVQVNLGAGTATGADGNDSLVGIQNVQGGAFDDLLIGSAGDNTFEGRAGNDTIEGGAGRDWVLFGSAPGAVTVNLALGTATGDGNDQLISIENVRGTAGADVLIGSTEANDFQARGGNDTVSGGAGDDTIHGGLGDDSIDGGLGSDRLTGDLGDDTYLVDTQADLIFEVEGEGTDSVFSSASFYLYPHLENLTLTGSAQFGVGNGLNNVLRGNALENLLIAGAGNDTAFGGDARDAIFGEAGADALYGEAGVDYIVAGSGNDSVDGGADADELYGQEGDDLLLGGNDFATDILVGGDGNDTLDGGPAWDLMYGGAGNDTFYVSQQVDWVFEQPGEGTDTVIADSPNGYYLFANVENLTLVGNTPFGVGNELANLILGNAIGNTILAGAGNDTLDGGAGTDILWGQEGADTFRIGKGTGTDIVADFQAGTDKLDLSAWGFTSLAQVQAKMRQVGSDVAIDLDAGNLLILVGVTTSQLSATDLVLGPPGG
jgi:Ca2+-binding RTX toxin-like protein